MKVRQTVGQTMLDSEEVNNNPTNLFRFTSEFYFILHLRECKCLNQLLTHLLLSRASFRFSFEPTGTHDDDDDVERICELFDFNLNIGRLPQFGMSEFAVGNNSKIIVCS